MDGDFNLATGVFEGYNDFEGIMLCGYEWGDDGEDEGSGNVGITPDSAACVTFSNKVPRYGNVANSWPYDRRIRAWFKLWGHELGREGTGGAFEKCLLQTNWCNTQAPNMDGLDYRKKLLAPDQINNFIKHVDRFRPKLIMFFGISMLSLLNDKDVIHPFTQIMGKITEPMKVETKPFDGKKFRLGFQAFEKCRVIALPHPSGSIGLNDAYISMFSDEIGVAISEVKQAKLRV